MANLREIHRFMNERVSVALKDGRTGKIVRVDTLFPANVTTVRLWTKGSGGPAVVRVGLDDVVGRAPTPV